MSLRLPQHASAQTLREMSRGLLDAEVLAEKASSLGHQGRLVEAALAALRAFDAAGGPSEERASLVHRAAQEVWALFVQRELCGLRDQKEVVRFYDIPQEVLVRLGVMKL